MTVNENLAELLDKAQHLLRADALELDAGQVSQLQRYVDLIREWNPVVGLVSVGDADRIWERHVLDSLSLAGLIQRLGLGRGNLLDIGSGGGFPAIPLGLALPDLRITLVERSQKKAGFLRKAIGSLGMARMTLCVGEFPRVVETVLPDVITSRAIESPSRLTKQITPYIDRGAVYLSQSGVAFGDGYSVEPVVDDWATEGMRRGSLDIVRRRSMT